MWKAGLLVVALAWTIANGQEQFLREVSNPSGPSQIILRGGFLGNSGTPDEVQVVQPDQQQQQQPVELSDPPQEQQQALALQAPEQPIPEDGNNNPFTNGDSGFGLRLTQPGAPAPQPVQQQTPTVSQQQQQQQQQQVSQQPQFILQHSPLTLPQLPPGQQYVDVYGRPIFFTQPAPQPPQPTASPTPPPTAAPVSQAPPVQLQQQALVDQYGRKLGDLQPQPVFQQQVLQQQILQPGVPVVQQQHVLQPAAVPVAQQILQPQILQNVIPPTTLLHKAPPPLTLQTYAIPTFRKVGNLHIPYAQKITVAKRAKEGVVISPPVPAPAVVKSKHRTVFSPVKVVAPSAPAVVHQEVHAAAPAVVHHEVHAPAVVHQEVHHAAVPAPVVLQEQQHVLLQQPQFAVEHHPQQLIQVAHHPVAVEHHQPLVQVAHHQPVAVAHPPLVQVAHPPVQVVHHQPVVVKKVKQITKVPVVEKHIIPDFTLIHQPILSKVAFQKHIFNVKHGSEPLIYQDLCTVYPYQKNLRACVLKKAILPELHHPDIRTINVENQSQQTDQSIIAGGSAIIAPAPPTPSPTPESQPQPEVASAPTVAVTKTLPSNIQETIRREKSKAAAAAKEAATTSQPETAETRDVVAPTRKGRDKRNKRPRTSSRRNSEENQGFKLV